MATILPVLPLRDIVVFPHMQAPLFVGRDKSVRALEEVEKGGGEILLVAQKEASVDDPAEEDVYSIGVVATILQLLKLPDGTVKVLVEGKSRAKLDKLIDKGDYYTAELTPLPEQDVEPSEASALVRAVVEQFEGYVKLNRKIPAETVGSVSTITDPGRLSDAVAAQLSIKLEDKQNLLEITDVSDRLEKVYQLMEGEIGMLQMERKIRNRVKRQMEKTQREYYLNEQMKAIQRELGDGDSGGERDEIGELEDKITNTPMSEEARAKADQELKKLRQMSPMSAESTVVRNYLDWLVSLPWSKKKEVVKDLQVAEDVLNADHYGLEKVKERILEYLAVQTRTDKVRGPILCLVGPPGVGKTSLGKSIAKATGRDFVRVSLGGVRDEAEIRGHRRTYIGSMPGRIIQSMKKAKTGNPLFLLDEIDKLGMDYRGDPSSALLEVLDPEQNVTFNDHYLEVDYDLSDTMFITTANSLNMPQPLLDRMEIIRIEGYTEDEKVEIAKRHLLPKVTENHSIREGEWIVEDSALRDLVRYYTRESGVRSLEREIAKLARKAVREIELKKATTVTVNAENLGTYAGVRKYRYGVADREDQVGVVTGLAWTEVGGELLTVEAVQMPGRGRTIGHRQPERRDEGVDLGCPVAGALARCPVRHQAADLRPDRHPRARAGRRNAEGRAFGRYRDDDSHRLAANRQPDLEGRRDDRRDHAARQGAADRRTERETARGPAWRHQDGADPRGEREGSSGTAGQRPQRADDYPGLHHRPGSRARPGAPAYPGGVEPAG